MTHHIRDGVLRIIFLFIILKHHPLSLYCLFKFKLQIRSKHDIYILPIYVLTTPSENIKDLRERFIIDLIISHGPDGDKTFNDG